MAKLKFGKYQHFKGGVYDLVDVAKDSENLEDLAVYQATYGKKQIWVRPLDNFLEKVKVADKTVPRFKYLGK